MAADAHAELGQEAPADATDCHTRGGLTGRCALEDVAGIFAIVLQESGEIRMARSHSRHGALAHLVLSRARVLALAWRRIHDLFPVLPVAVANQHRDGGTDGLAGAHAGEKLDGIALDLHASAASVSLLTTAQLFIDLAGQEGQPGGHTLEDGYEGLSV